jgi:glycosyltransferase involved in cell wall biosynthesis
VGERQSVTVVIPTRDSAHLLEECLQSVAWADEILVIDMNSSDGTEALCARFPQCRLRRREDYIFGNMNFGFEEAKSEWILRLDSDERITPGLRREIAEFLGDPPTGITGLRCWERLVVLGRELRWGRGRRHSRKLLFRRGSAHYQVKSEHEDLVSSGEWLESTHGYMHLNYQSVADYLRKTEYYTSRDVDRVDLPARAPGVRQTIKDVARPFYMHYLRGRGYRDGWIGFLDAGMMSVYQFVLWGKLRERWERERGRG